MKRLRVSDNKILLGVLGGVGEYFNIDPTILRLLFVFIPGLNFGIYILLYILMELNED